MRRALLDAEIDLQKAAAASQDMHRQLQVGSSRITPVHAAQDGTGCRPVVDAVSGADVRTCLLACITCASKQQAAWICCGDCPSLQRRAAPPLRGLSHPM